MSVEFTINSIFISRSITFPSVLGRFHQQLGHAQKIIRSAYPPSGQLGSLGSPKTRFPKSSHRLHPTEDLFDSLSYPLAYTVASMTSGSPIDSRAAFAVGVGRHMRENLSTAQKTDKVVGVIALICSQTFHPYSFSPLTLKQLLGGFPLRTPGGLTDFEIDQQPVSVLHQSMRPVTKLRLFARPLAHQKTVGIGGGLMGVVSALLAMKIHPAVAWISLIFIPRPLLAFGPKTLKTGPRLRRWPKGSEDFVGTVPRPEATK